MTNEKKNGIKLDSQELTKEDVNSAKEAVEEAREQSDILTAYGANLESEQQILEEIAGAIQKGMVEEKKETDKKIYRKDERDV